MFDRVRGLATLFVPPLIGLSVSAPLFAGEHQVRFTVEVTVEGTESVAGTGADHTEATFREGYSLVTYLKSDGELAQYNSKDPQYAQKMMGLAANVHRQVQAAQGKAPAKRMTPGEIEAYISEGQAACQGDMNCLMRLASEAQELAANLDMVGTEGEPAAEAYSGEEEPRYLSYSGYEECGASARVYVDRTTTGTFADVSGNMPYSVEDRADYTSSPVDAQLLCSFHQFVLDTMDGTLFTDGAAWPAATGTSTATIWGQTTQSSGEAATHGEVNTWVAEQLRKVPRSGSRTTTLDLTQNQSAAVHTGTYTGQARVELAWKLEDVD